MKVLLGKFQKYGFIVDDYWENDDDDLGESAIKKHRKVSELGNNYILYKGLFLVANFGFIY